MTDTNQPQTWLKGRTTDGLYVVYVQDDIAHEIALCRKESDADSLIADHAAATKLADALAEIERLTIDRNEWQELCFQKIERGNDAEAAGAALEAALEALKGAIGLEGKLKHEGAFDLYWDKERAPEFVNAWNAIDAALTTWRERSKA